MIVGENFQPGNIVQIVLSNNRVFSVRIPETGAPTFRHFLDSVRPLPYNSSPSETAELLEEFGEIMNSMLNSPMKVEHPPSSCRCPECSAYPECSCSSEPSRQRMGLCCVEYEDDLYNGEPIGSSKIHNVTIYANNINMEGE